MHSEEYICLCRERDIELVSPFIFFSARSEGVARGTRGSMKCALRYGSSAARQAGAAQAREARAAARSLPPLLLVVGRAARYMLGFALGR